MNKTISYDIRSKFYDNEVKEVQEIKKFISEISKKLDIKSIINCPCGSGAYLKDFNESYEKTYYCDLEKNMIEKVNEKILNDNLKNVEAMVLDINDMDKIETDAVIMLNQGLQYISLSNFRELLKNINHKYLILDLFDFNKEGKLTYFDSSIPNGEFYLSKSFKIDELLVNRYNKHVVEKEKVDFEYNYDLLDYRTNFTLYNYSFDECMRVINNSKYKVLNIYSDYQFNDYDNKGHYIAILERC